MRSSAASALALLMSFSVMAHAGGTSPPPNPAIDMPGFLAIASEAAVYRESHRVSEDDFIAMSRERGTVILDARSERMYTQLHVKGAINLVFSDIALESLRKAIPDRSTRILIYCNNNFANAEAFFAYKVPPASLNLSTYIALYTYGYHNVYELAPQVDLRASRLAFEGRALD